MYDKGESRNAFRYAGIGVLVALLGACGSEGRQLEATNDAEAPAVASAAQMAAVLEAGEEVFTSTCAECHSMAPPPKLAPPIMMVLGHYMEEYGDRAAAEDAMRLWLTGPDSTRSAMPAHAIERFGLMPPLPLADEQRAAVVAYLFEQYEEGGMSGRGGGMGQQHRGGQGMHRGDTLSQR